MEHLLFFDHNAQFKNVSLWSLDPQSAIHFLKGNDFSIREMNTYDKDNNKIPIRTPEDAYWVKKNDTDHYLEIYGFIEQCDQQIIYDFKIELRNKCFVEFCTGQIFVFYENIENIKPGLCRLLNNYGYFASRKILDFVLTQTIAIDISPLLGMENERVTEKELNFVLKIAEEIEENFLEYKKLSDDLDNSESSPI